MTLIELLIAVVVMAIGISAIVAGFSSGILAVNRARVASTAAALADKQMETFRQRSFSSVQSQPGAPVTGSDGKAYWLQSDVVPSCAVGAFSATPPNCPGPPASRPVKLATITVRDGSATAKVLFTETSTFDSSTG